MVELYWKAVENKGSKVSTEEKHSFSCKMNISSWIIIPSRMTWWNERPLTNYDVTGTSRHVTNRGVIWFDSLFKHKNLMVAFPPHQMEQLGLPRMACMSAEGRTSILVCPRYIVITTNTIWPQCQMTQNIQVMPDIYLHITQSKALQQTIAQASQFTAHLFSKLHRSESCPFLCVP